MASASTSTWSPLRHVTFRRLWIAQFVANGGTWAQTVGAQWLMGDLGGGPLAVALIQTAATLPVFLLVLPSGALGDILDRRRLLLTSQSLMLAGAATLTALTAAGVMSPAILLAGIAVMGCGAALATPTFAAIQPELVAPGEIPQAALLNGANLNVARAVGPAIGGALVGVAGPEATFALNTVSFLGVLIALKRWRREPEHRPLGTEHLHHAIVAGARYVRRAPRYATVLARALLFVVFASAVWALLPVLARGRLGLDASGYGLLLACIGAGAVVGAFLIPAVRGRLKANELVAIGSVTIAAAFIVVARTSSLAVVAPALIVGGLAGVMVTSNLSACAQVLLPNWARARGLAFFNFTYMGGQALGSLVWGVIAESAGLDTALLVAGIGLLIGPAVGARWLALATVGDVRHARHWPEPNVAQEVDPLAGPVLVSVEWRIDPETRSEFVSAMQSVGRSRRRTGATLWGLFQDLADPARFVETFTVQTWREHLRQHVERQTVLDRDLEARARRFLVTDAPSVRHLLWAFRDAPPQDGLGEPERLPRRRSRLRRRGAARPAASSRPPGSPRGSP